MAVFEVMEKSLVELAAALDAGSLTSLELVEAYLARIKAYDQQGPCLNAMVVINQNARAEARAADQRRRQGTGLGALDGIPYTAKDSFMVKGLSVAAGSPAFAQLTAQHDAFSIARLRAAGAICLGLTNMPPMANGGMQRGLYGRAESPYNQDYLTSAFASGSSNGSGTATAASFAAFGLGEETWSSGRAPAACNGLCAYTPSRGIISTRGNWPLVPSMDVVVSHTRSMADMCAVLDALVADDNDTRGDFWRTQTWITLPKASKIQPRQYADLILSHPETAAAYLKGQRLGVPRMYINADALAGTAEHPGIGGATGQPIHTRDSIMHLWHAARDCLEKAGTEVIEVDFPVVSNYEGDRPHAPTIKTRGLVPPAYLQEEISRLAAWSWDDFLRANNDPALNRLATVDGQQIFPSPQGALPDRYTGFDDDIASYPDILRQYPHLCLNDMPSLEAGLKGLEATREKDLEDWMDKLQLDAVIFPAMADIGRADMDTNQASADHGWRNGVWVANGNLAIRHLGIPTVTVPMGILSDIHMPMGLTFAGKAYADNPLLRLASAFEALTHYRQAPSLTPALT